jgi:hypothetical protein
LLLTSLVFAMCIVAVGYALSISVTGKARQQLPDAIENTDPVRDAVQVPAQTEVFVDMKAGYTGVLTVDGLELQTIDTRDLQDKSKPGQQIKLPATTIYDAGNATLTFKPSKNAPIPEFSQGTHLVTVTYWKVLEGRAHARTYTWQFNVF